MKINLFHFQQLLRLNYLRFDFIGLFSLGKQLGFCLVCFVSEEAEQIEFVSAFAAHELGQLVRLGHLKKKLK
jgi:hypothetical protein